MTIEQQREVLKTNGWKLMSIWLMGQYYVLDAERQPYKCATTKSRAIAYAVAGRRPDGPVSL